MASYIPLSTSWHVGPKELLGGNQVDSYLDYSGSSDGEGSRAPIAFAAATPPAGRAWA